MQADAVLRVVPDPGQVAEREDVDAPVVQLVPAVHEAGIGLLAVFERPGRQRHGQVRAQQLQLVHDPPIPLHALGVHLAARVVQDARAELARALGEHQQPPAVVERGLFERGEPVPDSRRPDQRDRVLAAEVAVGADAAGLIVAAFVVVVRNVLDLRERRDHRHVVVFELSEQLRVGERLGAQVDVAALERLVDLAVEALGALDQLRLRHARHPQHRDQERRRHRDRLPPAEPAPPGRQYAVLDRPLGQERRAQRERQDRQSAQDGRAPFGVQVQVHHQDRPVPQVQRVRAVAERRHRTGGQEPVDRPALAGGAGQDHQDRGADRPERDIAGELVRHVEQRAARDQREHADPTEGEADPHRYPNHRQSHREHPAERELPHPRPGAEIRPGLILGGRGDRIGQRDRQHQRAGGERDLSQMSADHLDHQGDQRHECYPHQVELPLDR